MSDLLDRIDSRFEFVHQQLSQYMVSDAGCWDYQGKLATNGYGRITIYVRNFIPKTRHFVASRVAYAYFNGVDPGAKLVCHTCDNPVCINPDHLFLGTPKENTKDMFSKGRAAKQYGEFNPASKITEGVVLDVIGAIKAGKNNKEIASELPITHSQVSLIRLGKSWKHLLDAANYDPDEYRKFKRKAG